MLQKICWHQTLLHPQNYPSLYRQGTGSIDQLVFKRIKSPIGLFLLDVSASHLRNGGVEKSIHFLHTNTFYNNACALISFGNNQSQMICPPTSNARLFQQKITTLRGGGGTPIEAGLMGIDQLIKGYHHQFSTACLFILTDGCFKISSTKFKSLTQHLDDIIILDTQPHLQSAMNLANQLHIQYQQMAEPT